MVTKSSDTKQELASTGPEKEHRHDATGALLERQQAAAQEYRANKAGETPDVGVAPVKPSKRTTSLKRACERWPKIRSLYVRDLAHLFGHEDGSTYNLAGYMGTAAGVRILIADHIKRRVKTQHAEQRMREALRPYKSQLHPAPAVVVQKKSVNPRTHKEIAPQLKRPIGPSNYAETLAVVFEIRALEQICSRDAMLQCKQQCVSAQMALDFALDTWHPFQRAVPFDKEVRAKVEAHEKEHASTVRHTDENGEQIIKARLHLATCEIAVRQRDRLKEHLKTLRRSEAWLIGILKDVQTAIASQITAQEKQDIAQQRQHAIGMIKAGYVSDFHNRPWARFLTPEDIQRLIDNDKLPADAGTSSNGDKK